MEKYFNFDFEHDGEGSLQLFRESEPDDYYVFSVEGLKVTQRQYGYAIKIESSPYSGKMRIPPWMFGLMLERGLLRKVSLDNPELM